MYTKEKIVHDYLKWIYSKTGGLVDTRLIEILYSEEFTWTIPLDKNRASDGVYLRNRFIYESTYDDSVLLYLDGPCRVIEMLTALALRMEEDILKDDEEGNRVGRWLRVMLDNLGVLGNKDENDIRARVRRFVTRGYLPNGNGNIFYIPNSDRDLRSVEIWYQMQAFLRYYEDQI